MTNQERFHAVLDFQPADRLPNYELGAWPQVYEQWEQEGLPPGVLYQHWFEGEPFFGLERRAFAAINYSMHPAFPEEVLDEDERYVTIRHANGIISKALKEGSIGGARMCMDQYIAHPVTDRASFREIAKRYDPTQPTRYPLWWDEQTRMWQGRDYPLFLLTNATFGLYSQLRSWVGTEEISYLFYDDPAFVEEMIEFATDFFLQLVEPALQHVQFDAFNFFEDLAGKGGPLISPAIFRRFFLPSYQRVTARLRRAGIRHIWYDSDGDVEVLIPLLIEAGITCLWPMEQACGMDPVRLRGIYGRDMAYAGGIDKRALMRDKRAIDEELQAKVPPLLESGGYIPFVDHTVPPEVSYENFLYYLDVKRRMIGQDAVLAG
jgi:uroporphyrinogen decarboxylase